MTVPHWHEAPIAHGRRSFDCGDSGMNEFLQRFARQSHKQNASKTSCAIDSCSEPYPWLLYDFALCGYSCQRSGGGDESLAQHEVAGFRLARLATDITVAGQGLGGQLLAAAALRGPRIASEGGGVLLIIDAKSERATQWYADYAQPLDDKLLILVMPLMTFDDGLKFRGLL